MPLPVLIALSLGYAGYKLFSYKCSICGEKKLGLSTSCTICKEKICNDCQKKLEYTYLCPAQRRRDGETDSEVFCKKCFISEEEEYNKYQLAVERQAEVETWSKNFRGRIPIKAGATEIAIQTDIFLDKDDALKSLKVTAIYLGFNIIYKVNYVPNTASSENYKYTTWRAEGIATTKE